MSIAQAYSDRANLYERLAPTYDKSHRRWLKHAGGEAQAALEAAVRSLLTPHSNLLDAGCGTGAFSRRLIAEGMCPERITLVDPSESMLSACGDLPVMKVNARLNELPFDDQCFDIVSCAWVLETVPDVEHALDELCRLVKPGGALCMAFCAGRAVGGPFSWLLREMVALRGAGRFLCPEEIIAQFERHEVFHTMSLPCSGPAFVVLARREPAFGAQG